MLYRVTARSRDACPVMATGMWIVRACTGAEAISMARLFAPHAVWPSDSLWSVDPLIRQWDFDAKSTPVDSPCAQRYEIEDTFRVGLAHLSKP